MTWYGTLIVFVVIWWCLFFMLLPVGVQPVERSKPGHDPGSPNRQRLGVKSAVCTIATILLTGLIWFADYDGWVDFRSLFTGGS